MSIRRRSFNWDPTKPGQKAYDGAGLTIRGRKCDMCGRKFSCETNGPTRLCRPCASFRKASR